MDLKAKLQKEYLPLQSKIIDITAEGDYFTQRNINGLEYSKRY